MCVHIRPTEYSLVACTHARTHTQAYIMFTPYVDSTVDRKSAWNEISTVSGWMVSAVWCFVEL